MPYVNLAAVSKMHRAAALIADIGASGFLLIYDGTPPASPDQTTTATMLSRLALSATPAVASQGLALGAAGATAITAGSGGSAGTYALAFSGGGGSGAAGTFTVSGGVTAINITDSGSGYTSPPSFDFSSCAGLTGASATAVLTGVLVFNAITQENSADATGTAGWVRIATTGNPGAAGIIDLDCGTSNASFIINTINITAGGPVICSSSILIEA